MLISENWADALDPIVRDRFMSGFARRPSLIETLFGVSGSAQAYERSAGVGAIGIDMWEQFEKTQVVAQADFDRGYKTTFEHKEFSVELQIRRKLLEDSNWEEIRNPSMALGDSARLKREIDAASVFNNAFTASAPYLGADSVALCSNSHPAGPDNTGYTQDNNFALALTKDNVKTIREAMMAFTDDKGNKVAVTPDTILVPPGLEDEAIEISKSVLDPDSANNTVNAQFGRYKVLTWHQLIDSNAWFLIDSTLAKMNLKWFNRAPLTISPKVEDKTLIATWIAYMRYSYGWSDWRWVAGSNPS